MEISIETEISRFYTFLKEKDNDNIIFSGKFGIGKTYFLDKFFNTNHLNEYLEIYISPVNYSVATNEDIFENIKINILFELLEKTSYQLKTTNISFTDGAYAYIKKDPWNFISRIAAIGEKIAFRTDITAKLIELKNDIDEYIYNSKINENADVNAYIESISKLKGSIYENDIITQLIRSIINDYKKKMKNRLFLL